MATDKVFDEEEHCIPKRAVRFRRGQNVTWDFGEGKGQVTEVYPSGLLEVMGKDLKGKRIIRLYCPDGVPEHRLKQSADLMLDDPAEADMMELI